jgi:hypothetical protein
MPQLTLPIVAGELALTCLVNVGTQEAYDLLAARQVLPSGSWVAGVIDTGTTLSCVSRPVLRQLGSAKAGQGPTQTALGPMVADLYRVSLSLLAYPGPPGPMLSFSDMPVLELASSIGGTDVLVGMDVVQTCKLIVDGPGGSFTLDF